MTDVAHTLGEFIAAWNAGERPRLPDYLERVPITDREDLADQIEAFLLFAPEPEYSAETWQSMVSDPAVVAAGEASFAAPEPWPSLLPRLRERAGLSWAQVAERLGVSDSAKAERRLADMETGKLDSTRPTRRLLERLGDVLGVSADALDWRGGGMGRSSVVGAYRSASPSPAEQRLDHLADALLSDDEGWDDVDELFLGGRE